MVVIIGGKSPLSPPNLESVAPTFSQAWGGPPKTSRPYLTRSGCAYPPTKILDSRFYAFLLINFERAVAPKAKWKSSRGERNCPTGCYELNIARKTISGILAPFQSPSRRSPFLFTPVGCWIENTVKLRSITGKRGGLIMLKKDECVFVE